METSIKDVSEETLDKSISIVSNIFFAIEALFVLGVFLLLKKYDIFIADCFIAFVYIYALYNNMKVVKTTVKHEILKKKDVYDVSKESKDIEEAKQED
jgi:hypothetical protein